MEKKGLEKDAEMTVPFHSHRGNMGAPEPEKIRRIVRSKFLEMFSQRSILNLIPKIEKSDKSNLSSRNGMFLLIFNSKQEKISQDQAFEICIYEV